ncbi:hypothetical protein H2O04_23160 [Pseudomonas aeruginosa]|jgi:hypothetical protein|uniref:Uncharacterized protein n=1 Tax=Pseudomonas aeruginosa TaxID=287 RepID=A0A1V0M676_PSEAI|nr:MULTISPECIES: hypothetical protein [Pseudomonas]ARD70396.1 Hypothetical protein [Pseudomonas aeruginosa]EIU1447155.1 hypothetical protein [Pseudomonas aeruginosa]EIU3126940.1 hypothetical protein [Pseudomonas aeruginosa]EKF6770389.1 hypothetical protein [Pseudomonas aeruginosa]EKI2992995.1 hypothetical protein [Pseudomonas aeruginosa]
MIPLYPALDLPALDVARLRRGLAVQTRIFFADSIPGNKAKVIRFWDTPKGVFVRCNYGKNQGGQSLLKTMPANVLAPAD